MNIDGIRRLAKSHFLVVSVIEGSPAEQAGLLGVSETKEVDGREFAIDGDVIVSIDGKTVRKISDILVHLQREKSIGDEIQSCLELVTLPIYVRIGNFETCKCK